MRFFYPMVNVNKLSVDEYCELQAEMDYLVKIGVIKLNYENGE